MADLVVKGNITTEIRNRRTFTYLDGRPICGATKKQGSGVCVRPPVEGRNRCHLHGGKSLAGANAPNYKTGRYSNDVATAALAQRYEAARKDTDMLSLREELALTQALIAESVRKLESGESGAAWKDAQRLYRQMVRALRDGDQQTATDTMNQLGRVIKDGVGYYAATQDVVRKQDHYRKLVETETKRMKDLRQMMSAEQAMDLLRQVGAIIKEEVQDINVLRRISARIAEHVSTHKYTTED